MKLKTNYLRLEDLRKKLLETIRFINHAMGNIILKDFKQGLLSKLFLVVGSLK